jgi:6-pyruvoyltetrahydropterin/6-carboxytetrahydropterin synthase
VDLTIMRRFTFCAGHRLLGHEGKCQNLHGHNYVVEIYVTGQEQDAIGRILDFKALKQRCKNWLDDNWDHTFILWKEDENALSAIRQSQPHRIYELDANPTAENMAIHLVRDVCPKILAGTGAKAYRVRLWETEETCADVEIGRRECLSPSESSGVRQLAGADASSG